MDISIRIKWTFFLLITLLLVGCQDMSARFIGIQSIGSEQLKNALSSGSNPLVLDIREHSAFEKGRIDGAILLDPANIDGFLEKHPQAKGRQIVTVCYSGWKSQIAAATIMSHGYPNVYNLREGMQAWQRLGYPSSPSTGSGSIANALEPPIVEISLLTQLAVTAAAFVIKPIYVLLSFVIALILWRRKERDLVLIRNAMVFFFIGENACTLNYLIASNSSPELEFIHGLGMVLMFFLLEWGLFLFFDERIVHYRDQDRPCLLQRLCKTCWKNNSGNCGLHRLALFMVPALAFVALIPVTMPLRPFKIIMPVFASNVLWDKDFWNLFFEFRIYPILGAIAFMASFIWLRRGKTGVQKAELPFFIGLGFSSYAFFRFSLMLPFRENQGWADWWEESTELVMIMMVFLLLIRFAKQLKLKIPQVFWKTKTF